MCSEHYKRTRASMSDIAKAKEANAAKDLDDAIAQVNLDKPSAALIKALLRNGAKIKANPIRHAEYLARGRERHKTQYAKIKADPIRHAQRREWQST